MDEPALLSLRALSLHAHGRVLVKDLALSLPGPGLTALIGPSGCGKSSVLKWLAGVTAPGLTATGELHLNGHPAQTPHRSIAYQPQQDALFPWLTLAENAALALELTGLSRRAAMARNQPLFAAFGLTGCETLFPDQLSGGMRQRAAFLRTLARPAQVLLLDEPFSALDAVTRMALQDWLLARLAQQPRAVLMVTHDLQEAVRMADQILVMAPGPGRIVARLEGAPAPQRTSEIATAPLRETLKTLLQETVP